MILKNMWKFVKMIYTLKLTDIEDINRIGIAKFESDKKKVIIKPDWKIIDRWFFNLLFVRSNINYVN